MRGNSFGIRLSLRLCSCKDKRRGCVCMSVVYEFKKQLRVVKKEKKGNFIVKGYSK